MVHATIATECAQSLTAFVESHRARGRVRKYNDCMITRIAFLGWILGLSTLSAADPVRLALDADTGITIREGFDAELL